MGSGKNPSSTHLSLAHAYVQSKKFNLENEFSNYSSILTYNETGFTDYRDLLDEYSKASAIATEQAGILLSENLQDQTARSGYALAGWRPKRSDMKRQAVEWWNWGMQP